MSKLFWFPTPQDSRCELRHDADGVVRVATTDIHPTGRLGQSWNLPNTLPDKNGARVITSHPDKNDVIFRGVLDLHYFSDSMAGLLVDDVILTDKPLPPPPPIPPPPPPPTGSKPIDIINAVYNTGNYNLATKMGCGMFTEACCTQLHEHHSTHWGHVKKSGAQNQFNGHAVDAIMLLLPTKDTEAGIRDIITDSESSNAEPAFNFAGPIDESLWFYPAKSL